MMTVQRITIRVMEKHGYHEQLPPSLQRALDAEARYEADKLRVAREAQREALGCPRGVMVALAILLGIAGIAWGIWRLF